MHQLYEKLVKDEGFTDRQKAAIFEKIAVSWRRFWGKLVSLIFFWLITLDIFWTFSLWASQRFLPANRFWVWAHASNITKICLHQVAEYRLKDGGSEQLQLLNLTYCLLDQFKAVAVNWIGNPPLPIPHYSHILYMLRNQLSMISHSSHPMVSPLFILYSRHVVSCTCFYDRNTWLWNECWPTNHT